MQGEFRGDFSRDTFDPLKHFRRVFMQQGRVQLDADWNEQTSILLHYLRTLAADLIGPQGGPAGAVGFVIGPVPFPSPVQNDFRIGLGHYYVDGILCEADSTPVAISIPPAFQGSSVTVQSVTVRVDHWTLDGLPFQDNQFVEVFNDVQLPNVSPVFSPTVVQITNPQQAQLTLTLKGALANLSSATNPKLRRVITYLTQPDYPIPPDETLAANHTYLIYLDVWERHITYVEDDSIREVALGGSDTASRAKVVWQVKAAPGTANSDAKTPCDNFQFTDQNFLPSLFNMNCGRLKAMAKQDSKSTDPCITAPQSRYSGHENQLYRVEIHTGGAAWSSTGTRPTTGVATFKWSRENGSVVFPIVSLSTGGGTTTVGLENLGRDDRFGLKEGEWVEVQDDDSLLQNRATPLLQVQSLDPTKLTAILSGTADLDVVKNANQNLAKHPLVRRWDHRAGDPAEGGLQIASDGAAYIIEGTWLTLEDGVQIQFQPPMSSAKQQQIVVNQYVTSDYWLIPARTATGDVIWPQEAGLDGQGNATLVPIAKPPDGIEHHYAPLAVITVNNSGEVTDPQSCQKTFHAIATAFSKRS